MTQRDFDNRFKVLLLAALKDLNTSVRLQTAQQLAPSQTIADVLKSANLEGWSETDIEVGRVLLEFDDKAYAWPTIDVPVPPSPLQGQGPILQLLATALGVDVGALQQKLVGLIGTIPLPQAPVAPVTATPSK